MRKSKVNEPRTERCRTRATDTILQQNFHPHLRCIPKSRTIFNVTQEEAKRMAKVGAAPKAQNIHARTSALEKSRIFR